MIKIISKITFVFIFFCSLTTIVTARDFIVDDTRFQQYNQKTTKETIDYFSLSPHFYSMSVLTPFPVYYNRFPLYYPTFVSQEIKEKKRINNIRTENTLVNPEDYSVKK